MKRKVPRMTTDREAEAFLAKDLSDLEFSQFKPVRFEFEAKSGQLNMRLPQALLDAVKQRAAARGIPYTKFVRQVLESDLALGTEYRPVHTGQGSVVGAKSRGKNLVGKIVRGAAALPAHRRDVVAAMIEVLVNPPAQANDLIRPALERIGKRVADDQAKIRKLSQEMADVRSELQNMAEEREDVTRKNSGLSATVAHQGNQIKLLEDRLRVVYESYTRDVAGRAQGALAVSSERH
jgi:predicted DNA binding CopG/RHH family protein